MIVVNGSSRSDLAGGISVSELLAELALPHVDRGVAVAVDSTVVPRSEWDEHRIAEGAEVEVLVAVQGG